MTQNNNISVLPFYKNIDEQNHKKSYAYGSIFPLIVPSNQLIPFQIMRQHSNVDLTGITAHLFDYKGNQVRIITQPLKDAGMQIVHFDSLGYDIIVFPAYSAAFDLPIGAHYIRISEGVNTWYSDIFTIVDDVRNFIKIEWGDVQNAVFPQGQIVYRNPNFLNRLYLKTEIGKPEYTFDETAEPRDGYNFVEKQISEKTYRCTALGPEYICDVMRFIRMSDFIYVYDQFGRKYNCDSFLITPKWLDQGDLASIEIEFQTDTVVKKIGRGYRFGPGDFNNDFNNDFFNNNNQ